MDKVIELIQVIKSAVFSSSSNEDELAVPLRRLLLEITSEADGVDDFVIEIGSQGTAEGLVTTYEVLTPQEAIDAYIENIVSIEDVSISAKMDANVFRFSKFLVTDSYIEAYNAIGSSSSLLMLKHSKDGGNSYFSVKLKSYA